MTISANLTKLILVRYMSTVFDKCQFITYKMILDLQYRRETALFSFEYSKYIARIKISLYSAIITELNSRTDRMRI